MTLGEQAGDSREESAEAAGSFRPPCTALEAVMVVAVEAVTAAARNSSPAATAATEATPIPVAAPPGSFGIPAARTAP